MSKLLFFVPLLLCQMANSQVTISEPEWIGNIEYIDSSGIQIKLESQNCSYEQKKSASLYVVGVGKVKGRNCVDGTVSKTTFAKNDTLVFVARHSSNEINPNQVFNIFRLEQNGQNRCVLVAEAGTFSGSKISNVSQIPFVSTKLGESSYLIKIANLEAGEYAISFEGSRNQFNLFSIQDLNQTNNLNNKGISQGDTIFFKAGGEFVEGVVESIEKYGVKARYKNELDVEQKKYVNYEYILFVDPRNQ